jgi:hypothetical protein
MPMLHDWQASPRPAQPAARRLGLTAGVLGIVVCALVLPAGVGPGDPQVTSSRVTLAAASDNGADQGVGQGTDLPPRAGPAGRGPGKASAPAPEIPSPPVPGRARLRRSDQPAATMPCTKRVSPSELSQAVAQAGVHDVICVPGGPNASAGVGATRQPTTRNPLQDPPPLPPPPIGGRSPREGTDRPARPGAGFRGVDPSAGPLESPRSPGTPGGVGLPAHTTPYVREGASDSGATPSPTRILPRLPIQPEQPGESYQPATPPPNFTPPDPNGVDSGGDSISLGPPVDPPRQTHCSVEVTDGASLSQALSDPTPGARICISGNLGSIRLEISKGGTPEAPISIIGNGQTTALGISVDASNVVVDGIRAVNGEAPGISLKGNNITLQNSSSIDPRGGDGDGIRFWGDNIQIRHNTISGTRNLGGAHADCLQTYATDADSPASHHIVIDGNRCEKIESVPDR